MLQWMGGSRRKITNSRKSTQKRQKQYFEQKKRQQHTNGLDDDAAEGIHGSAEYHRTPKSLDILSLLNLEIEAKRDNSGSTNDFNTCHCNSPSVCYCLKQVGRMPKMQNAVLYDIDMPTSHSSFDLPFNSRDIRDNHGNTRSDNLFVKGCKPLDGLDFKLDSLFTEGCFDNNLEDKSESPWNARLGFLDDDSTYEKMLDASTTSQFFEMDHRSDDFYRENTHNMHAFAYEDPYLQKRLLL
ncbi:hypothetical protein MKX01_018270 [Papaver californicum]|nr:hypothetical protein MKX01_018270 [Papaver californicum]